MRIKITQPGIFGQEEVPVGSVFTINGHPPVSWAGKYVVVDDKGNEVEGELVTGEGEGGGKAKGDEKAETKADEKGEEDKGERRPRPNADKA